MDTLCHETLKIDNCKDDKILTCMFGNKRKNISRLLAHLLHIEVFGQKLKPKTTKTTILLLLLLSIVGPTNT